MHIAIFFDYEVNKTYMSKIGVFYLVDEESNEDIPSIRSFFVITFENQGRYQSALE